MSQQHFTDTAASGPDIEAAFGVEEMPQAWSATRGRQNEHETPQDDAPDGAHRMPSGAWLVLADPKRLSRADKKTIVRAFIDKEGIENAYATVEALLTVLVMAWSYPFPIPAEDPGSLDRVPAEDDEAISQVVQPAKRLLFPGSVTVDDYADERSPTAPSGE